MTRKSMENLLEKLTQEQRFETAANQPMYGEISYERAAREIFDGKEGQDSAERQRQKGMALLLRRELGKTDDAQEDEALTRKIQDYILQLSEALPSIESDYNDFYNARETAIEFDQVSGTPKAN